MSFVKQISIVMVIMVFTLLNAPNMYDTRQDASPNHKQCMSVFIANKYYTVGETGVGWDMGWVGQRGFKYVPDN